MRLQQFYQFISMNKSLKSRHSKSEQRFILVHGVTKEQQPVRWNILTHKYEELSANKEQNQQPRMSYQQKKGLLNGLCQRQRASSSFKIRQGFSRKSKQRIISTASNLTAKSQKQNQPFIYVTPKGQQISSFNINEIVEQISSLKKKIDLHQKRLLAVLTVKRVGLRIKIYYKFVQICQCGKNNHNNHDLREISEQIKVQMKQFLRVQKDLYYFFFDRKPIHNYNDIIQNDLRALIVDDLPKLDLTIGILRRIQDLGNILQNLMGSKIQKREAKTAEPSTTSRGQTYDWQRIKNVKEYVDKLSEDPYKNKLPDAKQNKNELIGWYSERFTHNQTSSLKNTKQSDKNLLFESLNHYPNEVTQKKYLIQAGEKLQALSYIKNNHQYIPHRIDIMMEQVKRQSAKVGSLKRLKMKNELGETVTKRDLMRKLDKKNSLLSVQNIPYLIDKYGLNRFQIYNLYNLYKSFEKVSLLRNLKRPEMQGVIQKGIDRQTFEVGLKGLDMVPGEQLIKNICYFGDFISWQQFIKIISISLRKTPQEKLTAILKGISSAESGYLTRYQISLMIGNSLQKLFDREENQLKEYFTNMAMKELDKEGIGKVSIQILKQKVLGNDSQNLNMVSFLILNT